MSLLCFVGRHAARPSKIWNQGLCFSSCRRCGCDMVRADKVWEPVRHGFRIVWRRVERPEQAERKGVIRNLPMVIPQGPVELPSAPIPMRSRFPRRPLGLVQLVFLGVELLALFGAEGFTTWRRNVAAKRPRRRVPVLRLAG